LALDEHREAFSPTLWYLPKFGTANAGDIKAQEKVIQAKAEEWDTQLQAAMQLKASGKATDKQVNTAAVNLNKAAREVNKAVRVLLRLRDDVKHKNHPRTLKQVWFPGYHIHIGGGSNSTLKQEGDMEEMSNITFSWMLDQIKPFLFLNERYLDEERGERDRILEAIPENPQEGEFWGSWVGRSVTAAASVVRHPFAGAVELSKKFRKYGWGTGILEDSFTSFYHLNGSKRRTPGNYDILDKAGQPLGDTCEFIHPVVGYRHDAKGYQPIGGAPYKRYQTTYTDDKDQNKVKPCFEYTVGEAHRPLREWQLGGVDSYERLAIVGDDAVAYVTKLDAALGLRDEMPRRARPEDAFNQGGISPAGFSQGGFQRVAVSDEGFVENSLQEQHEFLSSEISSKGFQMTSEEIMFQETVMRG
jgi:hypothetical protein